MQTDKINENSQNNFDTETISMPYILPWGADAAEEAATEWWLEYGQYDEGAGTSEWGYNGAEPEENPEPEDIEDPEPEEESRGLFAAIDAANAEEHARSTRARTRRDEPTTARQLTTGLFRNLLMAAGIELRYDVVGREAYISWRSPNELEIMRALNDGELPNSERTIENTLHDLSDEIGQNDWETGDGLESLDMIANFLKKILRVWNRHNQRGMAVEVSESDILTMLTRAQSLNKYNPILDLLAVQTWDGVDRVGELVATLGLDSDSGYAVMVNQWLKQCIAGLFNDGSFGLEGCLILQGPQGVGKTSFFRKLAMRQEWFLESLSLPKPDDKDTVSRATKGWIAELGEIDSTFSRSEIGSLKAFLTAARDIYRPPYGKSEVKYPRKTSFCGGCNSPEFLRDTTGNRRFWVVPTAKIDLDRLEQLDVLQLWAQINSEVAPMTMAERGACFRLNNETKTFLEESNREFEAPLPGEDLMREDILDANEIPKYMKLYPNLKLEPITTSGIKDHLFLHDHEVKDRQIGQVLSKMGYKKTNIYIGPEGDRRRTKGYELLKGSAIRLAKRQQEEADKLAIVRAKREAEEKPR